VKNFTSLQTLAFVDQLYSRVFNLHRKEEQQNSCISDEHAIPFQAKNLYSTPNIKQKNLCEIVTNTHIQSVTKYWLKLSNRTVTLQYWKLLIKQLITKIFSFHSTIVSYQCKVVTDIMKWYLHNWHTVIHKTSAWNRQIFIWWLHIRKIQLSPQINI